MHTLAMLARQTALAVNAAEINLGKKKNWICLHVYQH